MAPTVVFCVYAPSTPAGYEIWLVNGDGANPRNVRIYGGDPALNPDASVIFYGSWNGANNPPWELRSHKLATGSDTLVTSSTDLLRSPNVNPIDPGEILYATYGGSGEGLRRIRSDGSGAFSIYHSQWRIFGAQYSPDASYIYFSAGVTPSSKSQIYRIPRDGTGSPQLIADDPAYNISTPTFSQDGQQIIYNKTYPSERNQLALGRLWAGADGGFHAASFDAVPGMGSDC